MEVLAIVINWARSGNIGAIVERLVPQADVVVVDNSASGADALLAEQWRAAGALVWRIPNNLGPPCRFVPALADLDHRYVLFVDDDFLPGERCVEACLQAAGLVAGQFATIGQIGRRFVYEHGNWRYRRKNSPRLSSFPCPCDLTCRMHFVRREHLWHVLPFRERVAERLPLHASIHDDLLLCLGLQMATNLGSFLIPSDGPQIKVAELDDNQPLNSRRRGHVRERAELIQEASRLGWRSLWSESWDLWRGCIPRDQRTEVVEDD